MLFALVFAIKRSLLLGAQASLPASLACTLTVCSRQRALIAGKDACAPSYTQSLFAEEFSYDLLALGTLLRVGFTL